MVEGVQFVPDLDVDAIYGGAHRPRVQHRSQIYCHEIWMLGISQDYESY